MGSSCVADGRPWRVDCRDGSPGLFGPEVRGGRPRPGGAFPCSEVDASEPASTLGLGPGAAGTAPAGLRGDFNMSRRSSRDVWVPVDAVTGRAGPLRTTSAYPPFDKKENHFLLLRMDSRLREAGAEVVYCLTRGAPKGPNLPRARLNHQGALFPGHGKATHSHTWAGEPAWLGVRGDATLRTPAFTGGTYFSRCLVSGVTTNPEPCGFAHPRLAVRGVPVSGEKGTLVVELSPGYVWTLRDPPGEAIHRFGPCFSLTGVLAWPDQDDSGGYAEVVRRGPARPVTASTGTQTSPDDLRLSLKSPPKPTGAVPVAPGPKPRVDAGSLASTSEQGKAPPWSGPATPHLWSE
ncbi:hypothetical protein ISCGN_002823 [Ixodes scapularis]